MPEAERYANALAHGTLQASERFVIRGGDVEAVLFERGRR
jgi:hypothetical protein